MTTTLVVIISLKNVFSLEKPTVLQLSLLKLFLSKKDAKITKNILIYKYGTLRSQSAEIKILAKESFFRILEIFFDYIYK